MNSNASVIMSSTMEKLLKPILPSEEKLIVAVNTNGDISFKNHPCITRQATIRYPDLDDKEEIFFDCQTGLASDSEDDFHGVNGENMSPSLNKTPSTNEMFDSNLNSSPVEEEIELSEIWKDPFWSDQVVDIDHRGQVLTVNKQIKLAQFLQDSSWIRQVVAKDNHLPWTQNFAHFKSKKSNTEPHVYRRVTDCYSCLPISLRLGFRTRERQNPVAPEN